MPGESARAYSQAISAFLLQSFKPQTPKLNLCPVCSHIGQTTYIHTFALLPDTSMLKANLTFDTHITHSQPKPQTQSRTRDLPGEDVSSSPQAVGMGDRASPRHKLNP